MKTCNACHTHVHTEENFCPLCNEILLPGNAPPHPVPQNSYPNLADKLVKYNFIKRLLLFLSLLGCGVSVLINLLVTPGFLWCLIVAAAVIYGWLVVPPLLQRGVNFALQAVLQVFFASALTISLDFIIGYKGWSTNYVIPSIIIVCILSVALLAVFNRTNWAQYILYQVIIGILGFAPLVLYLTGLAQNIVMALIPAGLGLASLLASLIFGDRTLKTEFKRRFHL
ncbi:DUF6320 domain-containing protein [Ruminococcaceae bacterium OttesenSCG-928-A16]|nr:DUF6320 domain-containing protein [Ruminococcaceae bacterium OttesenSCG-928-A16]